MRNFRVYWPVLIFIVFFLLPPEIRAGEYNGRKEKFLNDPSIAWTKDTAPVRDNSRLGPGLRQIAHVFRTKGRKYALAQAGLKGTNAASAGEGNRVTAVIQLEDGTAPVSIKGELEAAGAGLDAISRDYVRIRVPLEGLEKVGAIAGIKRVRLPWPRKRKADVYGEIKAESVELTRADGMHEDGITGSGVRVAVIDDGFGGLSEAVDNGELPAGLETIDLTGQGMETAGDHGTAVAGVVMDMAPGVDLLCININDLVDLQNAADLLRTRGVHVANLSLGWFNSSYYDGTGEFSEVINESRDNDGVFWTVSAGNEAHQHWRGNWYDPDGDDWLNFSVSDEDIEYDSGSVVFLNWNQYDAAATDLDLYVLDKNGSTAARGTRTQRGYANESFERAEFTYNENNAPYRILVRRYRGSTTDLDMTIFVGTGSLHEHQVKAYSHSDPACAPGAFSVGAVSSWTWRNADPVVEYFSSRGPTTDGRMKPELVMPDGISVLSGSRAYGTSFAAPAAAGAAALLLQQTPGRTPLQIKSALQSLAWDMGPAGADSLSGAGRLLFPNKAPLLDPIGPQQFTEGRAGGFEVTGSDINTGDPLTMQASTLPEGSPGRLSSRRPVSIR